LDALRKEKVEFRVLVRTAHERLGCRADTVEIPPGAWREVLTPQRLKSYFPSPYPGVTRTFTLFRGEERSYAQKPDRY
jgi:hypothetical protein